MEKPEWFEKSNEEDTPRATKASSSLGVLLVVSAVSLTAIAGYGIVRTIQANSTPAVAETATAEQEAAISQQSSATNSAAITTHQSDPTPVAAPAPAPTTQTSKSLPSVGAPTSANGSLPLPAVTPTSRTRGGDEEEHHGKHHSDDNEHEEGDDD